MSRGLGRLERAVLALVPESGRKISSADVVLKMFGREATEAQRRSLRRAVRSLEHKDLITTELEIGPVWVRDVVAGAYRVDGRLKYWKRDRGHRLGNAQMNTLRRPVATVGPDGLKQLEKQERQLRAQAKRLGFRLSKTREISCRSGRQDAYYGAWYLLDQDGNEVPWPEPGLHVTLDQVAQGLAEVTAHSAVAPTVAR